MFLVNSRLGLFTATPSRGRLFSRSYESNLPSSLTTLLPLVLGFSPHLPVSVCGTGTLAYTRAFLASKHRRLPYLYFGPFRPGLPSPGSCYLQVSLWVKCQRLRNLHRMCIDYAFRAGQNLPDKEFRYLRTVIVTAAVYRGFDSMLRLAANISS